MKYEILATDRFKKDLKAIMKRGYNLELLQDIVSLLAGGSPLAEKNKDHALSGNWVGHRECHITPDWLLIYRIDNLYFSFDAYQNRYTQRSVLSQNA